MAACLLNSLTEVAQVPVSTEGKIFKTTFFPVKSDKEFVANVNVFNEKSEALEPTSGKLPIVFIGFPFKVISAISIEFSSKSKVRIIKLFMNTLVVKTAK